MNYYLKNTFLLPAIMVFASATGVSESKDQFVSENYVLENGINMKSAEFRLLSGDDTVIKDGKYIYFNHDRVDISKAKFENISEVKISQELFPEKGSRYYTRIVDNGMNSYQVITRDRLNEFIQGFNEIFPKLELFENQYGTDDQNSQEARDDFANIFVDLKENIYIISSSEAFLPAEIEGFGELKAKIMDLFASLATYNPQLSSKIWDFINKYRNIFLDGNYFKLDVSDDMSFILDKTNNQKIKCILAKDEKEYYLNFKNSKLPSNIDSSSCLFLENENEEIVPLLATIKKETENDYTLSISSLIHEDFIKAKFFIKELYSMKNYYYEVLNFFKKEDDISMFKFLDLYSQNKELDLYQTFKYINEVVSMRIKELEILKESNDFQQIDRKLLNRYLTIRTNLCDIMFFLHNRNSRLN